ncbi:MAG: BamA/TamA family outer membrane protein [Deltaproteobacteria bacterium]|nr:BamA/TamA family outer membrane protein [Deltaproteobacteria bacterium]
MLPSTIFKIGKRFQKRTGILLHSSSFDEKREPRRQQRRRDVDGRRYLQILILCGIFFSGISNAQEVSASTTNKTADAGVVDGDVAPNEGASSQKEDAEKKENEEPKEEAEEKRVLDIQILGTKTSVSQRSVGDVFGIQRGDVFSRGAIRNGIKRIFATGTWANIEVFAHDFQKGVALQVVLTPDLVVSDIRFEVNREVPVGRLERLLDVQTGDRLTERTQNEARTTIEKGLADLGYPRASVNVDVSGDGLEDRVLVIRVQTNLPTLVRTLSFEGKIGLRKPDLQRQLSLWEGIPFDRIAMEEGLGEIKKLLHRRRHLGAVVEIASLRFSKDKGNVDVVIKVEPGPAYSLRMVGNEVIADAYLKAILNVGRVKGLSVQDLNGAKKRLVDYYHKSGFALVSVAVDDIAGSEKDERVLLFRVQEGPLALLEELVVEGAVKLNGDELSKDALFFVRAEGTSSGWFHRVDQGDVDDLLGTTDRVLEKPRAVEQSGFDPRLDAAQLNVKLDLAYYEPLFVLVRDRLEDTYNSQGFLQAQVSGPETLWLDGGRRVRVRYRVQEGAQTIVSSVRFEPLNPPISLDQLIAASTIAPGEPANLYAIEQTRLAIENALRRQGHPNAHVNETLANAHEGKADVLFTIDAGPKVTLGKVLIRGNGKTLEFVVRNRLSLEADVPYDSSAFEKARQRLLQSGLFSSVRVELSDDEQSSVRDVIVTVRERKPLALEIGGGASMNDGPRLFGTFAWRNILGLGMGLRTRWKVNNPRPTYGLVYGDDDTSPLRFYDDAIREQIPDELETIAEPFFFTEGQLVGSLEMPKAFFIPFDMRLHIDVVGAREVRQAFTLLRTYIVGGADAQPLSFWRISGQLEGEISDFNCPRDLDDASQGCGQENQAIIRRQDAGFVRQMTYRVFSSLDFRDDPLKPRSGIFASSTMELALGSGTLRSAGEELEEAAVDFVKMHGVMRGYIPIGPLLTIDFTLKGGNIFPLGDPIYVPLYKRFYLGGTASIRGFNEDEVLPIDDARYRANRESPPAGSADTLISFGGRFFLNTRSEARIDVGGGFELSIFLDAGQLFEDVLHYSFQSVTVGSGIGIRYATPVGPLALHIGARVLDGRRKLPQFTDLLSAYNLHISFGYF